MRLLVFTLSVITLFLYDPYTPLVGTLRTPVDQDQMVWAAACFPLLVESKSEK